MPESDAYRAMHCLRLEYAVGKMDGNPAAMAALQNVLDGPVDGRYFYQILDQPQIDELAVWLALDLNSPEEHRSLRTSLRTKFPGHDWDAYTRDTFLDTVFLATADPGFRTSFNAVRAKSTADPAWRAFERRRFNDLPIGLYLRFIVEEARAGDSDSDSDGSGDSGSDDSDPDKTEE